MAVITTLHLELKSFYKGKKITCINTKFETITYTEAKKVSEYPALIRHLNKSY